MKIFTLNKVRDAITDNAHYAFVIRATTESEARKIAVKSAKLDGKQSANDWLNPKMSTCIYVKVAGDPGVISSSYIPKYIN